MHIGKNKNLSILCSLLIITAIIINPFFTVKVLNLEQIIENTLAQVLSFVLSVFFVFISMFLLLFKKINKWIMIIINLNFFKKNISIIAFVSTFLGILINPYFTIKILHNQQVIDSLYLQLLTFAFSAFLLSNTVILTLKKYLSRKFKKTWLTLNGFILFTIITMTNCEVIFFTLVFYKYNWVQKGSEFVPGSFFILDDQLVYKAKKDTTISYVKLNKFSGKLICSPTFNFDKYSRRITPDTNDSNTSNHLLFFGESFLFGDAINDNETLPFYVAKYTKNYKVYNYGFICYGTQQMLARLESKSLNKEVEFQKGIAVYFFNPISIRRAAGTRLVSSYGEWYKMPLYKQEGNNFIKTGDIISRNPLLTFIFKFLSGSSIIQYFGLKLDLPVITDYQIELNVKLIKKSEELYKEQFPESDFHVLIYPTSHYTYPEHKFLIERTIYFLKKYKINYLDYSNLFTLEGPFIVKEEGHPSPFANDVVSKKLIKDLNLK